jgi:hypothetical protein
MRQPIIGLLLLQSTLACEGTQRSFDAPTSPGDGPSAEARGNDVAAGRTSNDAPTGREPASAIERLEPGALCNRDAGRCPVDSISACTPDASECATACTGCSIDGQCIVDGALNLGNPCWLCDPARNRQAWSGNDSATCDDGLYCTVEDRCTAGVCKGIRRNCEDNVACNGSSECDEINDACSTGENQCGANGFCNVDTGTCASTCAGCLVGGVCFANGNGPAGNPCLVCDTARSGTAFSPTAGTTCDDGLFCTVEDTCTGGVCTGTARRCEDGIACNGISECDEGNDRCSSGQSPCSANTRCNTSTGVCVECVVAADCSNGPAGTRPQCTNNACAYSCDSQQGLKNCGNNRCVPQNGCCEDNDCNPCSSCSGSGTCTPLTAGQTDRCPGAREVCDSQQRCVDQRGLGQTCDQANQRCAQGTCLQDTCCPGGCSQGCRSDGTCNCPIPAAFEAGSCRLPDESDCATSADCLSNLCTEWFSDFDLDGFGSDALVFHRCGSTVPRGGPISGQSFVLNADDCCDNNSNAQTCEECGL